MKKSCFLFTIITITLLSFFKIPGVAVAKTKLDMVIKNGMVSVDFVEADLNEVLQMLSDNTRIKIVIEKGITDKISLKFRDVPLQKSLKAIIGQNDYIMEYIGDSVRIIRLFNKKSRIDGIIGCSIKYNKKAHLISFLDCEGNVFKEIKLNPCQAAIYYDGENSSNTDIIKHQYIIVSSLTEMLLDKEGNCIKQEAEKFSFYGSAGIVVWEKDYGETQVINGEIWYPSISLTPNGERVIVTSSLFYETEETERVYVYDKQGSEIIRIPDYGKEHNFQFFTSEINFTSNGKYLTVELAYANRELFRIFYDLGNKKSWDVTESYYIDTITNEGIVNGENTKTREKINIDLKKIFGGY